MFDSQLRKFEYDRLNSVISQRSAAYYLGMTSFHTLSFAYLAYFFRFRRLSLLPTTLVSVAYYFFFTESNKIAYKLIVDNKVIQTTRSLGYNKHVQPVGHLKKRGLNFAWEGNNKYVCGIHISHNKSPSIFKPKN